MNSTAATVPVSIRYSSPTQMGMKSCTTAPYAATQKPVIAPKRTIRLRNMVYDFSEFFSAFRFPKLAEMPVITMETNVVTYVVSDA